MRLASSARARVTAILPIPGARCVRLGAALVTEARSLPQSKVIEASPRSAMRLQKCRIRAIVAPSRGSFFSEPPYGVRGRETLGAGLTSPRVHG